MSAPPPAAGSGPPRSPVAGSGPPLSPAAAGARVRRVLGSTVLVAEALVVLFAVLVAKDLTDVPAGRLAWLGGGLAAACVAVAGLLRRRWAYVAGSLLQVAVVASGVVVPVMFVLGAVFAGLWFLGLHLARRVERVQRSFAAGR